MATDFEELHQVEELAVNVSAYLGVGVSFVYDLAGEPLELTVTGLSTY